MLAIIGGSGLTQLANLDIERREVVRALARVNGNLSKAADLLGVSRPTLYDLLKHYDLTAG